jgi:hypothetical protein
MLMRYSHSIKHTSKKITFITLKKILTMPEFSNFIPNKEPQGTRLEAGADIGLHEANDQFLTPAQLQMQREQAKTASGIEKRPLTPVEEISKNGMDVINLRRDELDLAA